MKVSFLARDRERTVPMYIPDIYQNDRDEKLNQKKFTVTRQERNFHCIKYIFSNPISIGFVSMSDEMLSGILPNELMIPGFFFALGSISTIF